VVPLPDLSNPTVTLGTATVYSFRFAWGWAIFTINDATGEFHIQSDWGNYAYRWSADPKHLGSPTLTAFLARGDANYVADKLHYGRPGDREEFDEETTKRGLRRRVGEVYGARKVDKEKAQELLADLDDLDWDNDETFVRSFYDGSPDLRLLTEEPYEWACHRPTARYVILVDALLPFFFDYLRREVVVEARTE
jgi:hypothetical protein